MKSRIDTILESLTLDEKIKIIAGWPGNDKTRTGDIFGVERIGLPALKFGDGPVGVHWWTHNGASTCYPALICLAASFDEDTAYRYGEALGTDCRSYGVHVLLAPGVNLYRSPLCGRNFEYLGEDPELAGKISAAYIRGLQSRNVSATVKHFAANNSEFNRHQTSSDVDERTLHEIYLRAFELAVKEGQTGCIMSAYNRLNQQHTSENYDLTVRILREQWGFTGVHMSDWGAVYPTNSTAQTIAAELDLEMPCASAYTPEKIKPLLETGVVTEAQINKLIRHRLALMERFGWLDQAGADAQHDESLPDPNPATEAVALDIARNGIVLLKNENNTLPITPEKVRSIALIGRQATARIFCGGGSAYNPPHSSYTLEEALREAYGNDVEIRAFAGVKIWNEEEAVRFTKFRTPDGQQDGVLAEWYNNEDFAGDPVKRIDERPCFHYYVEDPAEGITSKNYSVRYTGQFTVEKEEDYDIYTVCHSNATTLWIDGELIGKPSDITHRRIIKKLSAGTHTFRCDYIARSRGWVQLNLGWEPVSNTLADYDAAIAAARESDMAIVSAGFIAATESEARDRQFAIEELAGKMIADVTAANPNTAAVLYTGGAIDVGPWIDKAKAVLCLWYPGQNGTLAAAEIIAGKTNPSGKIPFTWEHKLEDRGSYNCYHELPEKKMRVTYDDGVLTGYRWFDKKGITPRYPFGYGLSYTTFAYENLKVSGDMDKEVTVEFEIVNTGKIEGAESALVFVGENTPVVVRPPKELKATKRVKLAPGAREKVSIKLPPRAFQYWDIETHAWKRGSDAFTILVGPNAGETPLVASLN